MTTATRRLDYGTDHHTEASTGNNTGPISLDDCLSAAIAAAKAPAHYVKQTLIPRTAPELFNSQTAQGSRCIKIILDDGQHMAADMILIERQSVRIYAVNHESKPSSIDIPLKRRVW